MFENAAFTDLPLIAALSFIAGWFARGKSVKAEALKDAAVAERRLNRALAVMAVTLGDGWRAMVPTDELLRIEQDKTDITLTVQGKRGEMASLSLAVKPNDGIKKENPHEG